MIKKVSDHHAIIPTEQFVQLDHMTNEERKIYVHGSSQIPQCAVSVLFVYEQVSMEGIVAGVTFCCQRESCKKCRMERCV